MLFLLAILFNLSYIGESENDDIFGAWPRSYSFRIGFHGTMIVGTAWNTGQSTSLVFGYVPEPGPIKTLTKLQRTNIRSIAILQIHHNRGNNIQEDVMYKHIMALGPLRDKKTIQLSKRRQTIFVSNVKVHIVYTRLHSSKPSQWGNGKLS